MYKIGVVGRREKVACFMAAGFAVYEATGEDASAALKAAKNDRCAIIYIEPDLVEAVLDDIEKLSNQVIPAVIPLPEAGGGYGMAQLKSAVERAVGADIIFNKE